MQKLQEARQQEVMRVIENYENRSKMRKIRGQGTLRLEEEYDKYLKLTNNNVPARSNGTKGRKDAADDDADDDEDNHDDFCSYPATSTAENHPRCFYITH